MANFYNANGQIISVSGTAEDISASISTFKKIGVVGDSFASGTVNVNSKQPSYTALSWCQHIARLSGVDVVNFTRAGLSTRTWLTNSNGLSKLLDTEPQGLYILALGINDDNLGASYIGTIADINEDYTLNADTFYGNYGKIIAQIKEHAPNSKLVMTTLARIEGLKTQLDTAIKDIANHFGIPYTILEEDSFFTSGNFPMSSGHPSIIDYGGMAKAIIRSVENCMVDNADYFIDYADTSEDITATANVEIDTSTLAQACAGGFSFGSGADGTTSSPYYATRDNMILLSGWHSLANCPSPKTTDNLPGLSGSENMTTVGSLSDICVVNDEVWCFVQSADDRSNYGIIHRVKYDVRKNTIQISHVWHNFGHCNTVNYNPVTDTIIMGNGSGDYELGNKIYLMERVSEIQKLPRGSIVEFDDYGIEIDATGYDFGAKLNVFWANFKSHNFNYRGTEEYIPNMAYGYADDCNRMYILALGYGTNQYQYGTYVEPTGTRKWNGTYNVLASYQTGDVNETIGNPGSYDHCGQGADFIDGEAYIGIGHNYIWYDKVRFTGLNTFEKEIVWQPSINSTTGTIANCKVNGIAVTRDYLILAVSNTVYFIPR